MDKREVVWHPEVYRRFMGPTRFIFISSYFFKNFHERVDSLVEEWGLSKFSRDVLIGSTDILLRAHWEERRQEIPLQVRINEAIGGVGEIRIFFVEQAFRFHGYTVPILKPGTLEFFTADELASFQQNPSDEKVEEKLKAERIMLGWKKADAITEAATCVEFIAPNIGLVQDTIKRILEDTQRDTEFGKYLVGLYSGAGFGSILLEWSTPSREDIWRLVGQRLLDRLALSASRTDTYIVASHTSHCCFHYCEFSPENLLDIIRRLVSLFPGIDSLPLEEQMEVSRLWHNCRIWESKPDEIVKRLITARVNGNLPGQRYVIQEIGDRLESILSRHVRRAAQEFWGD